MKKNYLLGVLGVLLIVGIGISFAYFVSGVLFSGEGSSVTLEPGDMIKVSYDAGSGSLNTEGMIPGDSTSKDFTVTVTPTETEKEATYGIFLDITENTFVKCDDTNYNDLTNACTRGAQELAYTITNKDSGTTLKTGDLTGVTGKIKLLTETKTVDAETTFNYTITITFVDTGADQNHNQNKSFNGDVVVEFTTLTGGDYILANTEMGEGTPNFANTSCTSGCREATVGIYETTDNLGTTYYYRGDVENNYVQFAGYYWRIIRINGDGSIRIIYDGTSAHANGESSSDRQTGTSAYNSSYNQSYYVGYTYQTGAQRPSSQNSGTASTIKGVLDNWYSTNIANKGYDDKVVSTPGFCNDRNTRSGDSWVSSGTTFYYAPYERIVSTHQPTLKCSNTNDIYTTKVGLITADEVMFAGGTTSSNSSYYLYTGQYYWTMSPYDFTSDGYAYVFRVTSAGQLGGNNVDWTGPGVRPVINLSVDVTLTGSGTATDPYVVA